MIKIIKGEEVDGPGGKGKRHGVFAYNAPAWPRVCGYSRQPLLDACRQLQALYGVTQETAGLFREGRDAPDIWCAVDVGAATTVSEPPKGRIAFVKFEAWHTAAASRVTHETDDAA